MSRIKAQGSPPLWKLFESRERRRGLPAQEPGAGPPLPGAVAACARLRIDAERGELALVLRAWRRPEEGDDEDDNPDLTACRDPGRGSTQLDPNFRQTSLGAGVTLFGR